MKATAGRLLVNRNSEEGTRNTSMSDQKQPLVVFYKKDVLKNFANLTRISQISSMLKSLFNKVAGMKCL